jgi:hypothetical protein
MSNHDFGVIALSQMGAAFERLFLSYRICSECWIRIQRTIQYGVACLERDILPVGGGT